MALLDDLYSGAILEHSRRPRNHGEPESYDLAQEGINPGCGDELTLYLRVVDGSLATVAFNGQGCAISQAAASLMTTAVKGRSPAYASALAASFKAMLQGGAAAEELGESRVLQGIAKLPARVKCATLPWLTLEVALQRLGFEPRAS